MNAVSFTGHFDACVGHAKPLSFDEYVATLKDLIRAKGPMLESKTRAEFEKLGYDVSRLKEYTDKAQRAGAL